MEAWRNRGRTATEGDRHTSRGAAECGLRRRDRGLPLGHLERQAVAYTIDPDVVAVADVAGQQLHGQGVLDLALDQALQGPGAVRWVEALVRHVVARLGRQRDGQLASGQPLLE